jgi:hypothetical protein
MSGPEVGATRIPFCDYPDLQEILAEVEESPINVAEGGRRKKLIFRAPSVWHAALFLMALFDACTAASVNTPEHRGPLLFRGHSDADWQWNMIPRTFRPDTNLTIAERKLRAFSQIVDSAFRLIGYADFSSEALSAIAQHYGIPTDLLDFTVHPSVAVFFAASGRKTRDDQDAVVFYIPADFAIGLGAKALLAPPVVERLYIQRGLFLQYRESGQNMREVCNEVRFPLGESFEPILDGDSDMLSDQPWLRETIEWASTWAESDGVKDETVAQNNLKRACEKLDLPRRIVSHQERLAVEDWKDLVSDLLIRLLLTVHGNRDWMYENIARSIVSDNRAVVRGMLRLSRALQFQGAKMDSSQDVHRRIHEALERLLDSTYPVNRNTPFE